MELCSVLQDLERRLNSNLRQTMCTRNRKKECIVRQVTVWGTHVLDSVPQAPRELISSSTISRMMSLIRILFRCLHRLATSLVPRSLSIKWPASANASGLLATTMLCQPRAPSSQWMGSRSAPSVSKCSWSDQRMPISRTGEWVRWDQWPPIWRLFPQLTKQNWFGYDNPPVLLPYLCLCMVVCASCMLSQLCVCVCVCANIPQKFDWLACHYSAAWCVCVMWFACDGLCACGVIVCLFCCPQTCVSVCLCALCVCEALVSTTCVLSQYMVHLFPLYRLKCTICTMYVFFLGL